MRRSRWRRAGAEGEGFKSLSRSRAATRTGDRGARAVKPLSDAVVPLYYRAGV